MKNKLTLLFLLSISLVSGCDLVEGIFKAGFWSGILIFILVIVLIIYLISRVGGKK